MKIKGSKKIMNLFPAIDILDGKCVRLIQGDFSQKTIYNRNPVEQAKAFVAEGAEFIHVVDLDATNIKFPTRRETIEKIRAAAPSVFLQVGGGVRTEADAKKLAELGVNRAVVGTTAVLKPELLPQMATHIGVAAGLDVRDSGGKLAIEGWTQSTKMDLLETAKGLLGSGIEALVVTDISKDGMLSGIDTELMSPLLELLAGRGQILKEIELIASGGVSSLADLESLANLEINGKRVSGAIVGKAIYEGAITIESALKVLKKSGR